QRVSLALSDHEFDLVRQKLLGLCGIFYFAGVREKIPGDLDRAFHEERGSVSKPSRHNHASERSSGNTEKESWFPFPAVKEVEPAGRSNWAPGSSSGGNA